MPRKPSIRLSVEPLVRAIARADIDTDPATDLEIRQGRFFGGITLEKADRIACKVLKTHPVFIWGEEYERKVWFDGGFNEPVPVSAVA